MAEAAERRLTDVLALLGEAPWPASLLARIHGGSAPQRRALSPAQRESALAEMDSASRLAALRRAFAALRAAAPDEAKGRGAWPQYEEFEPHARAALEHAAAAELADADVLTDILVVAQRLAAYKLARGDPATARATLEPALLLTGERVDLALPRIEALLTLSEALNDLGETTTALACAGQVLKLLDGDSDNDLRPRGRALLQRAIALEGTGELDEAREACEQSVTALAAGAPDSSEWALALGRAAWIDHLAGDTLDARSGLERAVESAREHLDPGDPASASLASTLGSVELALGDASTARARLVDALVDLEEALGAGHPEVAIVRSNLADALTAGGELDGAREQLTLALEAIDGVLPPSHRSFHLRASKLAAVLERLGDHAGAVEQRERALRVSLLAGASAATQRARDLAALARARAAAGDMTGAATDFEHALQAGQQAPRDELGALPLASVARSLANVQRALDDPPRAITRYVQAAELQAAASPSPRWSAVDRLNVAQLLCQLQPALTQGLTLVGRVDAAHSLADTARAALEAAVDEALAIDDAELALLAARMATTAGAGRHARTSLERTEPLIGAPADAPMDNDDATKLRERLANEWHALAAMLAETDAWEEAQLALERRLTLLEGDRSHEQLTLAGAIEELATCRHRLGDGDGAIAGFTRALALRAAASERSLGLVRCVHSLARLHEERGELSEAESDYQRCLATLDGLEEPDPQWRGVILHDLADVHRKQGRPTQAVTFYRQAAAEKRLTGHPRDRAATLELLAATLISSGHEETAGAVALQAAGLLEEATPASPPDTMRVLVLAAANYLGRADLAACLLARAEQQDPPMHAHPRLGVLLADVHDEIGHRECARDIRAQLRNTLQRSTNGEPSSRERLTEWELDVLAGRHDEAIAAFGRSCAGVRGTPAGARHIAECGHALAFRLRAGEAFAQAEQAMSLVLEHAAEKPGMPPDLVSAAHRLRADARRASGHLPDALADYTTAIVVAEDAGLARQLVLARVSQGRALLALGEKGAAGEAFRAALTDAEGSDEHDLHLEGVILHELAVARSREERDGERPPPADADGSSGGSLRHFLDAAARKRRCGDCTDSLAASLVAASRTALAAGGHARAAEAAAEADMLMRGALITPVGQPGPRERLIHIAPTRWPTPRAFGAAWEEASALSPRALALLERIALATASASRAAPPDAIEELRSHALLEGPGLWLSRSGRGVIRILHAADTPPDSLAVTRALAPSPAMVACTELLARLAAIGELTTHTLLPDPAPLHHAQPDTLDAVVALAAASAHLDLPDAVREGALAGVERLADAVPDALPALALATTDFGELDLAGALLKHPTPSATASTALRGLAYHWLAVAHEHSRDLDAAMSAYEAAASVFADTHLEAERRTLGFLADLAEGRRELHAPILERVRALPWRPTAGVRSRRLARLLELSRLHALLEEPLAARGALAMAAADLRLGIAHDRPDARPAHRGGAPSSSMLEELTPWGLALLERLRLDEEIAARLETLPGLTAAAGSAWIVARGAAELHAAGLVQPDVVPGWFTLTADGRTAAGALVDQPGLAAAASLERGPAA